MPQDCDTTFQSVLAAVGGISRLQDRNLVVRDAPIRLQEIHFGRECVEGDMLRIRMHALPSKAGLDGTVEPLRLADDEGLGEETAFLYDLGTRVLVLQRNRGGVSDSSLAWYFQEMSRLGVPITLRHVLAEEAYSRLVRMAEVRRLEVHFAGITNVEFLKDSAKGTSVGEMIDVLKEFEAPYATFSLSMGRQRGSLLRQAVDKLYKSIVKTGLDEEEKVTKLEVTGTNEDDERDVFDLLAYRMVEVDTVEENSKRRVTYGRRRPLLLDAWKRRRAELARLFS